MATYRELLAQAKAEIEEIDAARAHELAGEPAPPLFLDVRERDEWDEGHLAGAVFVPRGQLESRIDQVVPHRDRPIVAYSSGGSPSAFAAKTLAELGYTDVASLTGGFPEGKRTGFPGTLH